jgi:asparagine N-glycosylation enzyme membrane subunit Stt3
VGVISLLNISREDFVDISRKIGIGITMIVPGFVLGGLLWSWFHSSIIVVLLELAVAVVYISIITGRLGPILKDAIARAKTDFLCFGKKQEAGR